MKTLYELYSLLLEELRKEYADEAILIYLCPIMEGLRTQGIISNEEFDIWKKHFNEMKPMALEKFRAKDRFAWWTGREYKLRRNFIQYIINTLKK